MTLDPECRVFYVMLSFVILLVAARNLPNSATTSSMTTNSWDRLNVYLEKLWIIPSQVPTKYLANGQGLRPMPQPFPPTLCLAHSFSLILSPLSPIPHAFPLIIKDVSC